MKITWNGHSCFMIEAEEGTMVLDPYRDGSVPGLAPLRLEADAVLCSHDHDDHKGEEVVSLTGRECGIGVSVIDTWHDNAKGSLRGPNRIHILEAEGMRLAHLGDLGCDLTEDQMEKLAGLDALFIPIGGYYTIDGLQAAALAEKLDPRVVIPMHYRYGMVGYPEIFTVEEFRRERHDIVDYDGNTLELNAETPKQTAFLRY